MDRWDEDDGKSKVQRLKGTAQDQSSLNLRNNGVLIVWSCMAATGAGSLVFIVHVTAVAGWILKYTATSSLLRSKQISRVLWYPLFYELLASFKLLWEMDFIQSRDWKHSTQRHLDGQLGQRCASIDQFCIRWLYKQHRWPTIILPDKFSAKKMTGPWSLKLANNS